MNDEKMLMRILVEEGLATKRTKLNLKRFMK